MRNGLKQGVLKEVLSDSLSEEHVTVIEQLSKPQHDEEIAADLDVKATVVRTILNDLHARSLVEYERTKNKKTGWYTYLWKKREDKINEYIQSYLHRKLESLDTQLVSEKNSIECNTPSSARSISPQWQP